MEDFLYRRSNVLHVCDSISHSIGSILWRGLDSGYFLIHLTVQTEPNKCSDADAQAAALYPVPVYDNRLCFSHLLLDKVRSTAELDRDSIEVFRGSGGCFRWSMRLSC